MDTPEFNRLRKIQQLGLCSRVFKDASHNRFSHSVGVSHLAGTFATQLNDHLKREHRHNPTLNIIASERDIRCVQIAGKSDLDVYTINMFVEHTVSLTPTFLFSLSRITI